MTALGIVITNHDHGRFVAPTLGELLGVPLPGLDGRPIPGVAG